MEACCNQGLFDVTSHASEKSRVRCEAYPKELMVILSACINFTVDEANSERYLSPPLTVTGVFNNYGRVMLR